MTDHDVAAFVDVVAGLGGRAGPLGAPRAHLLGRARHRARAADRQGGRDPGRAARAPTATRSSRRAREHADTLCVGRTHGVHAEPTTFGVKLAGFAFEADRNLRRLERAVAGASVGALSGAVGTYAANGPELEAAVLERLGLAREDVSTQVVARDRHAELLSAMALAGAGLERFATEVRHLQRTEVREVRGAVPRRPEGLVGDAAQAQPDRERADHRHRAAAARLRAGRARGRGALARARHLALLGGARGAARRHDPARLRPAPGAARGGGDDRATPSGCARTSTPPTARSTPSARCSRWWSRAARATRPTGSCRRTRSAPGTRACRSATCSPRRRRSWTSTRSSTRGAFVAHADEIVGAARLAGLTPAVAHRRACGTSAVRARRAA